MPMKDGIIELRQKGASLRLIRELLATVDVAVRTNTITHFLAEVSDNSRQPDNVSDSVRGTLPFRTRSEFDVQLFRQETSR